ncbi:P-loop containing nucleoside triphosphate hydrolase protein [Gongronella butleri]|nr:P-loop containing nucleoside triphosphate hydrolase protein [Gongronella butleri]
MMDDDLFDAELWMNDDFSASNASQHSRHDTQRSVPSNNMDRIPSQFRSVFPFDEFNAMQSISFDKIFDSDGNLVIVAPTGAGKTVLLELAMVRCFMANPVDARVVYMAPTRALCTQKADEWAAKFHDAAIACHEYTGDTETSSLHAVRQSGIIVTTPEKWDSMTRGWHDHPAIVNSIRLFMIDEVQILKQDRGASLEACVSRLQSMNTRTRMIAVSATVPNVANVTQWLKATPLTFGDEYRPIQLHRQVVGFEQRRNSNAYAFDHFLDWKLLPIIKQHSPTKPVLVFCTTRSSAESACAILIKMLRERGENDFFRGERPLPNNLPVTNEILASTLQHGIAFHHAGLDREDRCLVEQLFCNRAISLVATTSTLAMGVNLPAHLVIIKSTKTFQDGVPCEYSEIDILQMMGRAGRPGYEATGTAVILTTTGMVSHYREIIHCRANVESSLQLSLHEHVVSEIRCGTIRDAETFSHWLQSTFLYVRAKENPQHYTQLLNDGSDISDTATQKDIFDRIMRQLTRAKLVKKSGRGKDATYDITNYGSIMDRLYIKVVTMQRFMNPNAPCLSIYDTLVLLSNAAEFQNHPVTSQQKANLKNLCKHQDLAHPLIHERVTTVADKINIVIQCVLSGISLYTKSSGSALVTESHVIMKTARRVAKCLVEVAREMGQGRRLYHAISLHQCLVARSWNTGAFVFRQLQDVGPKYARSLYDQGIQSLTDLRTSDPSRIEMLLHRSTPFGTKILTQVNAMPHYVVEIEKAYNALASEMMLTAHVTLAQPLRNTPTNALAKGFYTCIWLETDQDHDIIAFDRKKTNLMTDAELHITYECDVIDPTVQLILHVQNEDFVGLDIMQRINITTID